VSPDGRNVYAAGGVGSLSSLAVFSRNGATGALAQLAGTDGCLTVSKQVTGCAHGRALETPSGLALSPDGRNLYVAASNSGALASHGCIAQKAAGGCASGIALQQPGAVAVSPDGKNVYVASVVSSGVAVFLRTPLGSLTQLPGRGGCVTAGGSGGLCEQAPG